MPEKARPAHILACAVGKRTSRAVPAAIAAAFLPLTLLLSGCEDEPTAPLDQVPEVPQVEEYIVPVTGTQCGGGCLRGDVVSGWDVAYNAPSGRYMELKRTESTLPLTEGGQFSAVYCYYAEVDGAELGCTSVAWWSAGGSPTYPDRQVQVIGYEQSNIQRLTFTSMAPVPTLDLVSYERPDDPTCTTVCWGEYKVKVELKDAEWYLYDRLYVWGRSAEGAVTEYTGYATVVKDDDTFEFTFPYFGPTTPGSSIVVGYYPWQGLLEGYVEIVIPLTDPSPTLTLEAEEVFHLAGPMAVSVAAGTPVDFTAAAPGATIIEYLGWKWIPADTSQPAQTGTCAAGVNPCSIPVMEGGTMEVTARVDGRVQTASATVGVSDVQLQVTASETVVEPGQSVTFEATAPGATSIQNVVWTWTADEGPSMTLPCMPGELQCTTQVFESGVMSCEATVDGIDDEARVAVEALCNLTGDSVLDDRAVRERMLDLLEESGAYNMTTTSRREIAGYIYRSPDGTLTIETSDRPATPCSSSPGAPRALAEGETVVGMFHTHPFFVSDYLPTTCGYGMATAQSGRTLGGGSTEDWKQIDTPFVGNPLGQQLLEVDPVSWTPQHCRARRCSWHDASIRRSSGGRSSSCIERGVA